MTRDSPAVDEGVDAYCLGVSRNACPYEKGTAEQVEWVRGWDEVEEVDFADRKGE